MKFIMGISKAYFKAEKFTSQLGNTGHVKLLRKCYRHLRFLALTWEQTENDVTVQGESEKIVLKASS